MSHLSPTNDNISNGRTHTPSGLTLRESGEQPTFRIRSWSRVIANHSDETLAIAMSEAEVTTHAIQTRQMIYMKGSGHEENLRTGRLISPTPSLIQIRTILTFGRTSGREVVVGTTIREERMDLA